MRVVLFLLPMLSIATVGNADTLNLVCEFGQGAPVGTKPVSKDWENIRLDSAIFAIELDLAKNKAYSKWFPAKYVAGASASSDDYEIVWSVDMLPAGSGYTFRLNRHTGKLFVKLTAGGYIWASEGRCTKPKQLF